MNAYVTGFLASKRIVLWDTLLARLDEPEVLFVMGHEMGHYVLGHVLQGIVLYSLLAGLGLYAIHRLAPRVIARWCGVFGFARLGDVASLPLLLLLLQLGSFAILPGGVGLLAPHGARGRPLRSRAHAEQSRCRDRLREAPADQSLEPTPGPALRLVARIAPEPRRPHRLREHVPALGARRGAALRRAFRRSRTQRE